MDHLKAIYIVRVKESEVRMSLCWMKVWESWKMEREHSQNRKMQTKSFLQYNRPIQAAAVYFN